MKNAQAANLAELASCTLSAYVEAIKVKKGFVIYHTLYGRPTLVNREGLELLRRFPHPGSRRAFCHSASRSMQAAATRFRERGFLVPTSTDEREDLRRAFQEFDTHPCPERFAALSLVLSDACNLSCPYCMTKKVYNHPAREAQHAQMSFETARRAIDKYVTSLQAHGKTHMVLGFSGGEPLMNRRVLLEVLAYLERIKADPRAAITGYSVTLITNGTLITEELARQLSAFDIVHVSVSLDGPEDVHNRMRPSRYQAGAFRKTVAGMKAIAATCSQATLGVFATLRRENIDALGEEWFDLVKGLGVRVVRLDPDFLENIPLPTEHIVDRLIAFRRMARDSGLILSASWEDPYRFLMRKGDGVSTRFRCAATLGGSPCVRPDGSIYPCTYTGYRIGHLDHLEAAFEGEPFRKMVAASFSGLIPQCRGCSIEGLCRGDCYSARLHAAASPPGSRGKRCEILRRVFKAIVIEESKGRAACS